MSNIINISGLHTANFINGRSGNFRAIVKVKAGFHTNVENEYWKDVMSVFNGFKKGALQTIEFKPEGSNNWLTVFAMKGKNVILIDEEILKNVKVGDINSAFLNTNLYNQDQYKAVNAKTWACNAYVMN
jgi:hypothetical protein